MLSLFNLWTVARFEIKTLLRSWFFRIFASLSILILIVFNLLTLTEVGFSRWMFRGIPVSIPYVNILLLNAVQAVIAVFLASDFLKRDKKLDTTEVVYMRSMTNADYVLGKTLGILMVFALLNLLVLLIAALFNLLLTDVPFNLAPYLYYPLFISMPTLVYIFGLSFLLMSLIRNQAVTFVLLLGYIAVTIFFLSHRFHYLFDYMAFNVPLMASDFVGFGNVPEILVHRGIYFFFGLGFIFATVFLLKRLPQSIFMTRLSVVLTILFIVAGMGLAIIHLARLFAADELRQNMIELNRELQNTPRVSIIQCALDFTHQGYEIEATARLIVQNNTHENLDRYEFSLNPGLKVQSVKSGEKELKFDRKLHILSIKTIHPLATNGVDSLSIHYRGTIEEDACYLDIDRATREKSHRFWLYNIDKRYAFVTPDYVLLTPENLWYPVAGVNYRPDAPAFFNCEFIQFRLKVTTEEPLYAFSQGRLSAHGKGRFSFQPEMPLPQITLAIGKYKHRSITVDSVQYNLLTLSQHNYYHPYANELGDTLSVLIRELKQDYERELNLPYVFPRLSLVEVPLQFITYPRLWTISRQTVQPEIVLLPENGITLAGADFKQALQLEKRRMERTNQVMLPEEIQARLFNRFVTSTFTTRTSTSQFMLRGAALALRRGSRAGRVQANPSNMESLTAVSAPLLLSGVSASADLYSIYPNYFTFVNHIQSEKWPIINMAFESFLSERSENLINSFMRNFTGLSSEEKANLALMETSLAQLLEKLEKPDVLQDVLKLKGKYLFKLIQSKMSAEEFQAFLDDVLTRHKFQVLNFETLNESLKQKYQFDLQSHLENWFNNKHLPAFILSNISGKKILVEDHTRFQVKFTVTNPEPAEGLMVVSFRSFGRGRFGGRPGAGGRDRGGSASFGRGTSESDLERIIYLAANQTKDVGIVLDNAPRLMTVNTLISKNLPATFNTIFEEFKLDSKAKPFDGERILETAPAFTELDEIIVDNEDTGFEILDESSQSLLKKIFQKAPVESAEKYSAIQYFRSATEWQATTRSDFYGQYIHSAYYIKAGRGDKKVAWNAQITDSGNYDVYVYISNLRQRRFRRQVQNQMVEQYHYRIFHDDGSDEVVFDLKNADNGWNYLGSYYFSSGPASVELSDESSGRIVIADAVKWVKR